MSKETEKGLAVLQQSGNLPGFLNKVDAKALNREAAKGAGGGESINRISVKQSRFRLIVGGVQVKVFAEPQLDVIVLRANPEASKVFFDRPYDPNAEDQMPDCWSDNGIHPSPNVENKVSRWCKNCPKNAWGSAISKMTGKKIKACDDRKRLAIVPANRADGDAYQLSIPGASLGPFAQYLNMLDQAKAPYNGVVTRVSFDPEADYPKLEFEPVRYLSDDEYEIVAERFATEEVTKVATITEITDPPPEGLAPAPEVGAETPPPVEEADPEAEAKAAKAAEEKAAKEKAEKAAAAARAKAADDWGDTPAEAPPKKTTKAKAVKPDPEEVPAKGHEQVEAEVVESGSAVDKVFDGWDD